MVKNNALKRWSKVISGENNLYDQKGSGMTNAKKRWGEIQRLGIAGFVTETGDCCLDLADEISKYFRLLI